MTSPDANVPWQGLNHLALITNDMDTTVRFWHGVMGAPLIATIGTDTFKHYFFRFGESTSVAFFQYTGHESKMIAKPAGVFDERAGQFDHLSMDLPDEEALLVLRQRLLDARSEVTDVVNHGLCARSTSPTRTGSRSRRRGGRRTRPCTRPTMPTTRSSRIPIRCRRSSVRRRIARSRDDARRRATSDYWVAERR